MPKAKTKGKKTTSKKGIKTTKADDIAPVPTMPLPDISQATVPDLDMDPTGDDELGKEVDAVALPDNADIDTGIPTLDDLSKDIEQVTGKKVSGPVTGLAEEFLPLLNAKVEQIQEKLEARLDSVQAALTSAITQEFSNLTHMINSIQGSVNTHHEITNVHVLPTLARVEKILQDGVPVQVVDYEPDFPEATDEVEVVGDEEDDAVVEDEEGGPIPASYSQHMVSIFQSYGKLMAGQNCNLAGFIAAILEKHQAQLIESDGYDPSEPESKKRMLDIMFECLDTLGYITGNKIVFPA